MWALTREEMKNCLWVKPELVVQIEFGEWTPDGHLRHPKFVGWRDDKDAREVVREIEVSYDSEALPGLSRSVTNGEIDLYDCKQQKLIQGYKYVRRT